MTHICWHLCGKRASFGASSEPIAMFWDYFKGFRSQGIGLPDYVPWGSLVGEDNTILCKDESLFGTWHLEPFDQGSWSEYEQGALMNRLNLAGTHMPVGWGIWTDLWHHPAELPAPRTSTHRLAHLIERDHRRHYDPDFWTQDMYLSLWKGSLSYRDQILTKLAMPLLEPEQAHSLTAFDDTCEAVMDVVRSGVKSYERLGEDAFATYLHGLVSDEQGFVRMPAIPTGLDYALTDCDLDPGWYPRLCRDEETGVYLAMLSFKSFPMSLVANSLQAFTSLPFGIRVSSRWLPQTLQNVERQMTSHQRKLATKEYGLREAFAKWIFSEETRLKNRFLDAQKDDADLARFEALKEEVAFGEMSLTIVLADANIDTVKRQRREVERVLRLQGLVPRREWVNPIGAYLSTLPGVASLNPRRWQVSSLNWLDLSPFHAPSRGTPPAEGRRHQPLMVAKTAGCNPYWMDILSVTPPHILIAGPSGSGKSTLMKMMGAQWLADDSDGPRQLFWLDYKRSARLFILAMGGKYLDLGRDEVHFQPCRDVDNLLARAEAYTWLCDRVKESSDPLTGYMEEHIQVALETLAKAPVSQRTLSELYLVSSMLSTRAQLNIPPASVNPVTGARDHTRRDQALDAHKAFRRVLQPFTRGHIYGHLFDADHDDLLTGRIIGVEIEALMRTPQLLVAAEAHIWSRWYPRLTGVPTLIPMDEAGEQLKYPIIRDWVDRGARMLREKTAVLMLATQNHQDFTDSTIGPMLRTFAHQMYLPNANALDGGDDPRGPLRSYQSMGLNVDEIRKWVAAATPMQDVYDVTPEHRSLIHLRMAPIAAQICAPSSPAVHDEIDRILAQEAQGGFAARWLYEHGFPREALEVWQ
jgi:type IV secretion system protein TrbE